jgi:hypothetical protein
MYSRNYRKNKNYKLNQFKVIHLSIYIYNPLNSIWYKYFSDDFICKIYSPRQFEDFIFFQYKNKEIFIDLHDFSGVLNIIYNQLVLEKAIQNDDQVVNFKYNNINMYLKNNMFSLSIINNDEHKIILTFDYDDFCTLVKFLNRFSLKCLIDQNNWLKIESQQNLNTFFNDCYVQYKSKFNNLSQFSNFLRDLLKNNSIREITTVDDTDKIKKFVEKNLKGIYTTNIWIDIVFVTVYKIIIYDESNKITDEIKTIQKNLNIL